MPNCRLISIVLSAMMLNACQFEAWNNDKLIRQALDAHYADYDSTRHVWATRRIAALPDDGASFVREYVVCAELHNTQVQLIAICGVPRHDAAPAHVDAGLIDLWGIDDGKLLPVRMVLSGSTGEPGTVTIEQIGPQQWAFKISSAYVGMGYASGHVAYHAMLDGQITEVLSYIAFRDNEGTGACDSDPAMADFQLPDCVHVTTTLKWLPDLNSSDFFVPEFHYLQEINKQVTESTTRVTFDTKKRHFPLPEWLTETW